jgi:hypothetical protein
MKGAQTLFNGPQLNLGGDIPPVQVAAAGNLTHYFPSRYTGAGLFAIEVGSGHVYALAFDNLENQVTTWVRLP